MDHDELAIPSLRQLLAGALGAQLKQPDKMGAQAALLWGAARFFARIRGYNFSASCARDVQMLIRTGLSGLRSAQKQRSPIALSRALISMNSLVAAMVRAAKEQGAPELQEWSLRKALGWLCPLYPFC